MTNIDKVIDAFVTGDYFIVFLVLTLAVLVVLILALIKSRGEYNELLSLEEEKRKDDDIIEDDKSILYIEKNDDEEDDLFSDLSNLIAQSKEDEIDEDKPLVKQVDIKNIKTYDDEIDEYEDFEEKNAIISSEELEKRKQERINLLGEEENQSVIDKYEEEQEKKAIISYEQLLENASNITLSYKEEKTTKDSPKINKVEVEQKEVTSSQNYLAEEEFLKILKEFRISLNENIFN